MAGLVDDFRYALRALGKNHAFTAVAILSLALGIGANTTVFTMLNGVLLRPLPVWQPDRLAAIHTLDSRAPNYFLNSYLNYKDYRDRNGVFTSLLLYTPITVTLSGAGEPRPLLGQIVSGNYFATLGVRPAAGRDFLAEEDATPGAKAVAIISYGMWARDFASDPQITSRSIRLNDRDFQIVGVAPSGFQGLNAQYAAEFWVPLMTYPQVFPIPEIVNQRRSLYFSVVGRMKPGVTLAQAEAAMQSIARSLAAEYPKDNQGRRIKLTLAAQASLSVKTRRALVNASGLLLIVSLLVLLIACANVANLLLARAAARSKEITVRLALGASRWQLMRQLLVESLTLSIAGGILGLLVARWGRDLLWSMRPPDFKDAGIRLDLDPAVLGYSMAVAVLTGILFGLVPAFRATTPNLAVELKERAAQSTGSGRWHPRSLLVIGQVAFSLVALVGAGLFLRSLLKAAQIDPGFDAMHLSGIGLTVDQSYNEARFREFERRVLDVAASVPGVDSEAFSKDAPLHVGSARTVLLGGEPDGRGPMMLTSVVSSGYFRTLRIPLVRGRDFSALDEKTAPRVAILNEAAAARLWPHEEATGKVVRFTGEDRPVQIVGVARNANYREIGEAPEPMIYLTLAQYHFPYTVLYIHTAGDPDVVTEAVRLQIRKLDRSAVLETETVPATIRASLWAQRLSALLLTVFGALALLLAMIGIYGVIAYSVHQRAREVGLRMALGATRAEVQWHIVGEGMRLVALGVLAGTAISLALSGNVKTMLFRVSERDAVTFVLVPSVLALVAVLACWIPSRRAAQVDPSVALRDE